MKRVLCAACALMLLIAGWAIAQSKTTATISGTVTDPTGAVVPDAKITVTGADTGLTREVTSDARGEYQALLLPPGVYEVRVSREGFTTQTRKDVAVTVGEIATVDVQLAVGAPTQIVEVTATPPAVEVERTHQANTINEAAVRNLPINRRDYLSFTLLAPGVADSKAMADANSFRVKQTPDSGLSFYGSNGRGNNVSVDGGEANDAGGGVRPTVSQEAVQEFQINRTNYSAEHGAARGGVVNIITKSGTNLFRGSVFGFFRDEVMDAGDPFALVVRDDRITRVKPDSSRQQFGAAVGGPLSKDRTFFFLSYEQLRRRESQSVPLLATPAIHQPTAAQEAVLRSMPAAIPSIVVNQLRLALTSPPETREMFRVNSGIFPFRTDDYKGFLRLDHRFNESHSLLFRFNTTKSFETNPNLQGLVGYSRGFIGEVIDATGMLGLTSAFSHRTINELRGQYNYYNGLTDTNDKFGPALEIFGTGLFNRDRFLPSDVIERREEIVDNLTLVRGSHTLKLGGQLLLRNNHSNSATFFSGRFTFGTLPGIVLLQGIPEGLRPALQPSLERMSVTPLQAFNLGLPQSFQQGFGDPIVRATNPLYAGYIQDTWKPAPNLTLNFGVRYEVDVRKEPLPTDKNNVAPRFGFAWDPWNDRKTTIRGGYGLFFSPIDFQIDYVVNALNEIGGVRQIAQFLTVLNPLDPLGRTSPITIYQTLRRQGVIGVPTPTRSITSADLAQFGIIPSQTGPRPPFSVIFRNPADYQNPYAQQGSFGIEREVAGGLALSAGYVFVRGTKLTSSRDDNLLPAPTNPLKGGIRDWGASPANPTGAPIFFKNPLLFQDNVYESGGDSFYHGLIFEANKRFSRNVSIHGNYTFSKAIDETVDFNSDFQPNDQLDRRAERALSAFDQRHKVVLWSVLQAAAGDTGAKRIFGNFTFTPIFRANSGRPFNLLAGTEINNDRHNTTDRPIYSGRNTGRGPNFWTFDVRLARRFGIGERAGVEFIAEAFNLFNRLNFATVNNIVCAAPPLSATGQPLALVDYCRAGLIGTEGRHDRSPGEPLGFTSASEPRRIQLGVRVNW